MEGRVMTSRPWYAFYPKDYEQKTAHLTIIQDGAYRRLLDRYYMSGQPLPANADVLHRVCRAFDDAERSAIAFILTQFFTLTDHGYVQDRVEEELRKAESLSETRRNAANTRYAKAPALAEHLHTQSQSQSQSQEHIQETPSLRSGGPIAKRKSRSSIPEGVPLEADRQWSLDYWLKKGRVDLCDALAEEAEKFRDHHNGKLTASADWSGSWRTWTRNAMKFSNGAHNGRSKPNGKHPTSTDKHLDGIASLIRDIREGGK